MKHNRRNYLRFLAELVSASKATVIFLILLFSLVSFSNCYMISEVSRFNKIIVRSHEMHLEGRYFFQGGLAGFLRSDAENRELLNSLIDSESIKDVTVLNYFSGGGVVSDFVVGNSENWETGFCLYNLSDSHKDPSRILTVHDINDVPITSLKPNHVLLDETARKEYKVGDHINLSIIYFPSDAHTPYSEAVIDVVVDGFIRSDEMVINSNRSLVDLSLVFTTVCDPLEGTGETQQVEGHRIYLGVCSVLSANGQLVNSNEDSPCLYIITPEDGAEQTVIFNDIKQCGLNPQDLISYERLLDNYLANHKDEIRMIKTFSLAISLLTLCVMITIFLSWYTYKRKELGIFVISGCPWKTAILLSVLPYYFSIIIGGLSGFSGWALYEKYWKTEFNVIRWKTFLMLIVVYIIIYSIGVLIYYLMYRRSSPVSLYRDRE